MWWASILSFQISTQKGGITHADLLHVCRLFYFLTNFQISTQKGGNPCRLIPCMSASYAVFYKCGHVAKTVIGIYDMVGVWFSF